MKYNEFLRQKNFNLEQLIAFSYGRLITDPPEGLEARLPAPPFLMVDRIVSIESNGNKGGIVAEQDIRLDAWYFQCHFPGDPVQPGCLGVDAVWQLLGFYGVWRGGIGSGRALGCEEVVFNGQIRPHNKVVRFEIDVVRFRDMKSSGSCIVMANAVIFADDKQVVTIKKARSGIFKGIAYKNYPYPEDDKDLDEIDGN
ncbi:MAG: bifunctional 3-hydroxydecanoyl-ACP dehydratase/trans-2-decenoyl-ACP isomerase [Desulfobacteraceae bacterium]|nr:bifunctional 3-hydroxydecanoyl-ACP dehydratase/trans-2-decenoyl-ACP isomerase [Desulfobacteraceae bacterium]MCF8094287.1 bifunctional 3-hydroxydecanoyl-ACP dehydratase/trans-2-decenoyl-ACP isomerase [Desulfobacteraceae bacterium]